jgi:hypothetical protein
MIASGLNCGFCPCSVFRSSLEERRKIKPSQHSLVVVSNNAMSCLFFRGARALIVHFVHPDDAMRCALLCFDP